MDVGDHRDRREADDQRAARARPPSSGRRRGRSRSRRRRARRSAPSSPRRRGSSSGSSTGRRPGAPPPIGTPPTVIRCALAIAVRVAAPVPKSTRDTGPLARDRRAPWRRAAGRAPSHSVAARRAAGRPPRRPLGGRRRPRAGTLARRVPAGPLPHAGRRPRIGWFSPARRAVVPLEPFAPSRSLRRARRRYEIRVDTAFADVVAGCARPGDPHELDRLRASSAAYERLHELGWAHSVEAWDEDGLAGGLYGVAIGGLFAAESMFHVRTDASKAAFVGLVELLRAAGDPERRLLDVQWLTPHLDDPRRRRGPASRVPSPARRTRLRVDALAFGVRKGGRCRSRGRSRTAAARGRCRPPRPARRPPGAPHGRGCPRRSAKTMWPPSSGRQRQEVEQGDRERDEPEDEQEALGALLRRVGGSLDDADGARDLVAPGAGHEPAERGADVARHLPVRLNASPDGLERRQPFAREHEPEAVGAVGLPGRASGGSATRSPSRTTTTVSLRPSEPEIRCEMSSGCDHGAVDRDDPVARLQAGGGGGRAGRDRLDGGRRLPGRRHEEPREEDEGEHDVRRRAGGDRGDPLPRRRPPVGVRAERVLEVVQRPLYRGRRRVGGRSCSAASSRMTRIESRAASWSSVGERAAQAGRRPLERTAPPQRTRPSPMSTSPGEGRCIPGIFTKPPSGIAPMPYSIPLCVRFQIAGGNPM